MREFMKIFLYAAIIRGACSIRAFYIPERTGPILGPGTPQGGHCSARPMPPLKCVGGRRYASLLTAHVLAQSCIENMFTGEQRGACL